MLATHANWGLLLGARNPFAWGFKAADSLCSVNCKADVSFYSLEDAQQVERVSPGWWAGGLGTTATASASPVASAALSA